MIDKVDLIVRNAKSIDERKLMNIAIKNDKIVMVEEKIRAESKKEIDAEGCLASPGFVDAHTHLDKAFVGLGKSDSGTLTEAIEIGIDEKRKFTVESVKNRARRALEMALKNGTTALRTHVDVDETVGLTGLKGILELKKEFLNKISIQIVAFATEMPFTASKVGESLLRKAMSMGADVVGGAPNWDPNPEKYIDRMFSIAKDFDADIDLHIDESNDPNQLWLDCYAEKTVKNGYEGRVAASHCCSLSAVSDKVAERVIERVREAKMNIIANPLSNLYVWGKDGRPLGITRVRKLLDAGVDVVYGTDNINDVFCPLGNADMLLGALLLAYTQHMCRREDLTAIFKMGTLNAAKTTKINEKYGIGEGCKADLVILDAEDPQEAIIHQAKRLYVVKNGKIVVKNGAIVKRARGWFEK